MGFWSDVFGGGRRLRALEADLAGRLDAVSQRLAAIEHKLFLLEHFSQGANAVYVGDNRVLTKTVVAGQRLAFFVEANDRLLSPWFIVAGAYETEVTNFFVRALKPDSRVVDIGANFGYFACLAARFAPQGRVLGLEPDRHVFEIARDNLNINGFHERAEILQAAATDAPGPVTLHRRRTRSANTSIARADERHLEALGEPASEAFVVDGVRIDDLLERMGGRIDFLKIDVEGAEPLVLRGAARTIADNPQLQIVLEWSPLQIAQADFDVAAFVEELRATGLSPFDLSEAGETPLSYETLAQKPYAAGIVLRRA